MAVLALRFLLLILFIGFVQCRIIRLYSSADLISDGVDLVDNDEYSVLNANASIPTKHTCELEYGFLPCAENAAGYIFQILVYQGLMMFGEMEMATGSKVLFQILGASNIVGIIFRILVGLPALLIMIASGVFSSKDDAQTKVSLGVGIYAGMTVFTLTIQWGVCLFLSKIKWQKESATTSSNPSLAKTVFRGLMAPATVNIDDKTHHMAGLMLLSLIPYIVVQLLDIFKTSLGSHMVTLIALTVSFAMLLFYFVHQVMNPWMQQRSLAYNKTLRTEFLRHLQRYGALTNEDGNLNLKLVRSLFSEIDKNEDHSISKDELENLILELVEAVEIMNINGKSLAYKEIKRLFDKDKDDLISLKEFEDGCRQLVLDAKEQTENADSTSRNIHEVIKEKVANKELTIWIFVKCVLQIMLGIAFMTFLEEPLTGSILHLSDSMNASPFVITFVVVPLAMNARAGIVAICPSPHRKAEDLASLTFSEIYGGVVMSNISNLTALLAIVYAKDLTWNYSAEVLIVLVVCAVIGIMAYFHSGTYCPWACLVAFFLYPFSLGLFYVVQYVLHWN